MGVLPVRDHRRRLPGAGDDGERRGGRRKRAALPEARDPSRFSMGTPRSPRRLCVGDASDAGGRRDQRGRRVRGGDVVRGRPRGHRFPVQVFRERAKVRLPPRLQRSGRVRRGAKRDARVPVRHRTPRALLGRGVRGGVLRAHAGEGRVARQRHVGRGGLRLLYATRGGRSREQEADRARAQRRVHARREQLLLAPGETRFVAASRRRPNRVPVRG